MHDWPKQYGASIFKITTPTLGLILESPVLMDPHLSQHHEGLQHIQPYRNNRK